MKLKKGFILREVADTYLVVAVGEAVKKFNKVINLNSSGAYLWKAMEEETTEEELVNSLLKEYEIGRETAEKDVASFVKNLREADLLE